jgi:hypothetical protein
MSLGGRLSDTGRRTIRERLVAEVGGYLRNVVREPRVTCAVCATPIKPAFDLCLRCWRDHQEFRRRPRRLRVAIVALARWLKPEEPPAGAFVTGRLTEDYEPLVRPVNDPDWLGG